MKNLDDDSIMPLTEQPTADHLCKQAQISGDPKKEYERLLRDNRIVKKPDSNPKKESKFLDYETN